MLHEQITVHVPVACWEEAVNWRIPVLTVLSTLIPGDPQEVLISPIFFFSSRDSGDQIFIEILLKDTEGRRRAAGKMGKMGVGKMGNLS